MTEDQETFMQEIRERLAIDLKLKPDGVERVCNMLTKMMEMDSQDKTAFISAICIFFISTLSHDFVDSKNETVNAITQFFKGILLGSADEMNATPAP